MAKKGTSCIGLVNLIRNYVGLPRIMFDEKKVGFPNIGGIMHWFPYLKKKKD